MKKLRGHRLTLFLALCAIALGIGVYVDRGSVTTGESELRRRHLFDAWRGNEVSAIDVSAGDTRYQLRKKTDGKGQDEWELIENGESAAADPQAIGQLLVSLEFASYERKAAADRATMGLDAPALELRVSMGRLGYEVTIGNEAPKPSGGRYVEVHGGGRNHEVYVISGSLFRELSLPPGALKSRHFVPYISVDVARFELEVGGRKYTLERGGWGGRTAAAFRLKDRQLGSVRASRPAFDGWLVGLGKLEVGRFVPVPDNVTGLRGKLTEVPLENGKPHAVLEFADGCGDDEALVIRRKPVAAAGCVPEALVSAILVDPSRFVDRHVVGAAKGDVYELTSTKGAEALEIARKGSGWIMRKPDEGQANSDAADRWLESILALQGERIEDADRAALGLAPPSATLRVVSIPARGAGPGAAERLEHIDIGAPVDGRVHVRRHDDDMVLRLSQDAAEALLPYPGVLRATALFDIARERVLGLGVDCGAKQEVERSADGKWTLIAPKTGIKVDTGLVSAFAKQMRELEVVRWTPGKADEERFELSAGRARCRMTLRVSEGDGIREHTIVIGRSTPGGYYATYDRTGDVFVAPKAIVSAAGRWMLDRAALLVDVDKVRSVTLTKRGETPVLITRSGDTWLSDVGGDQLASDTRDALKALLAEAVVRPGPAKEDEGFGEPLVTIAVQLDGGQRVMLRVGVADTFDDARVYYVRRDEVDATFAVARARLRAVLEAL